MNLRSRWLVNKTEVVAKNGIVTAMTSESAEAGLRMLKKGGNAIDAGVAMAFCNTVIEPSLAALGGLGFMLIYLAKEDRLVAVDFNTRAPRKARSNMYKIKETATMTPGAARGIGIFEVENRENAVGAKSITVPATCAGLCLAHELYGRLPREDVLAPAIHLASEGFAVNWVIASWLARTASRVKRHPVIDGIWYPGGYPASTGTMVVQADYARLLKRIAQEGSGFLYKGDVAAAIEREVLKEGGILTREDLASYEPKVSEPLTVRYRDYVIAAVPTPCGGPTVLESFNILEDFDLQSMGHNTCGYLHMYIECTRHSFADRYSFLGDWEHANVPLDGLLSKEYAKEIAKQIDPDRAGLETELTREPWVHYLDHPIHDPWKFDHRSRPKSMPQPSAATSEEDTTHFNAVDKDRNVVTCTHTSGFEAGVVPPGTGLYLTGSMAWFVAKPDYPNSIAPWKRPLLNMTPLMVLKEGLPILAEGAPGGRMIMNHNTQVILNVLEFNYGIQDAIAQPTLDTSGTNTLIDSRIPEYVANRLKAMGHRVTVVEETPEIGVFARPTGILIDHERGLLYGGADVFRLALAMGY
jgi:gamma-glutamyltranspeptidase/glutathione hydrolase